MLVKSIATVAVSLIIGIGIGYCIGKPCNHSTKGNIMENDINGVKAAINDYINAGKQGKSEILRPSAYKDAIMYSAPNGVVEGGPINSLFEFLDTNPAAPELEAQITTVDVAGDIAYARVESDKWLGAKYTDMFLLVRDGDKWKILTKVFHTHNK